jgi:pimeloyl-ACP methyl ester carboxylesterase
LQKAKDANNKKALQQLAMINPPYLNNNGNLIYKDLIKERSWLGHFGGIAANSVSNPGGLDESLFFTGTEYTLFDLFKVEARIQKSVQSTWREMLTFDAITEIPNLETPVYFFAGMHDYNTPVELLYDYYNVLKSTKGKYLIKFENSGHILIFEEYQKFKKELLKIVDQINSNIKI